MRAWIGVDPGKRGEAALIMGNGEAQAVAYPGDVALAADIVRGWKRGNGAWITERKVDRV